MAKLSNYFSLKEDENGEKYLEVYVRGIEVLRLTLSNKGTAFTKDERIALGLDGLLPPRVTDLAHQVERLYRNYLRLGSDLDRYEFLRDVQERAEIIFYALLEQHLEEMLPIVYTPTVGLAVQQYSSIYKTARGLTLSPENIDRVEDVVNNYPWHEVRMIVVTDSSAILGIGDQGHGGLAICIGKLALYTAGGGLSPFHTMPVNLDVGTNRKELLEHPHYLGVHQKRLTGEAYFDFMDKFVEAAERKWPKAVIQWEDFSKDVAFKVLERYRDKIPCFNDDIQGTGAVVLAGLLCACKQKGESLTEQRVVIAGAGAGGIGVACAILEGMVCEGLDREQARRQMFVIDGRGLVVKDLTPDEYKQRVAQALSAVDDWDTEKQIPTLMEVVENARPTVLIGLTGVTDLFSEPLIRRMASQCECPIIFPLSNPTAHSEAIPEDIFNWTEGRAVVATGSPFNDVEYEGKIYPIGQGNNAFIFPGLGFASVLGKCRRISDAMVLESAYALADYTTRHYHNDGRIFPPVSELQNVSKYVTKRVLAKALEDGSSERKDLGGKDLADYIEGYFWKAEYLPFVAAKRGG